MERDQNTLRIKNYIEKVSDLAFFVTCTKKLQLEKSRICNERLLVEFCYVCLYMEINLNTFSRDGK